MDFFSRSDFGLSDATNVRVYCPHLTLATPSFAAAIAAPAAALQVPGVELGRRRGWMGAVVVKGVRRERRGARVAMRAAVERVVARVAAARVAAAM